MNVGRIMIAAPKSGSGKTVVTCALLQALKDSGRRVVSFKCGPDYIDPMFHEKVIGVPSKNLDTFFTDEEQTRKLFLKDRTENDFAVLEGVMGLYDGLGGERVSFGLRDKNADCICGGREGNGALHHSLVGRFYQV